MGLSQKAFFRRRQKDVGAFHFVASREKTRGGNFLIKASWRQNEIRPKMSFETVPMDTSGAAHSDEIGGAG